MKFLIFSRLAYCPYCDAAKDLLKEKGYQFEEVIADQSDLSKSMFRQYVNEAVTKGNISADMARTVPQVFVKNPNLPDEEVWIGVGGYTQLVEYLGEDDE